MKYHTRYRKYRWFVYRCKIGAALDLRCPLSGITSHGHDEVEALDIAFRRAYQRYPVRPWELLVVVQVTDAVRRRQCWLMERAWKREIEAFEELMTVPSACSQRQAEPPVDPR
jgi:hypothetical protein